MAREHASPLDRATAATHVGDRAAWDEIVAALGGRLLQSWGWGEFKSRHGWAAERLAITAGGEALAAAQVLFKRVGPLSVAYVPRGPLVGDDAALPLLTVAIDALCRARRAVVAFIEPERPLPGLQAGGSLAWRPSDLTFQPKRTIKVSVDRSDDDLLARMKPKTRYNVRLATRRGVTARVGKASDLPAFYRLLQETSERDEFGIHGVEYYRDALETLGDAAALIMAEIGGEPAAGVIVARFADEAIYLYGASATAHQRHMPAYLAQFEAMRWARARGCRLYDLWGIPWEDEPGSEAEGEESGQVNVRRGLWGVYRFKQGFGGEIVEYPGVFERPYVEPLVRLWRRFGRGLA